MRMLLSTSILPTIHQQLIDLPDDENATGRYIYIYGRKTGRNFFFPSKRVTFTSMFTKCVKGNEARK